MTVKILLPTSVPLDLPEREGVEYVFHDSALPIPVEHEDATGLVFWGGPDSVLKDAAQRLSKLRWVQLLSAGSDNAVRAGFGEQVTITAGRSLHDRPVAEHALALVLAAARRLHTLGRAQIGHRWANEIGGLQPEPSPGVFSTLRGARVLIWGFGGIAKTLAPHLVALGATVTGVATSPRDEDGYRVISTDTVHEELPQSDVLIMILPGMPSTDHSLNAERIALLPKHAWVINVGRGSTVDEDALLAALGANKLGGAALDVTAVEPLPADSPLWDQSNLIITPHAAGGRPIGAAKLIDENVGALLRGEALQNIVAR